MPEPRGVAEAHWIIAALTTELQARRAANPNLDELEILKDVRDRFASLPDVDPDVRIAKKYLNRMLATLLEPNRA